jgi:hypothetical protein
MNKEVIFYGDDVLIYDFPEEVKIFHANDPITPLEDEFNALNEAIDNPMGSEKLEDLLNENSRVAICFDDVSVPLPPMKEDVRAKAAEVVLKKLRDIGVNKENILFICATGLHRKCKPKELAHMLGKKVFNEYKNQIINHDAADEENLKILGKTKDGFEIEINKYAAGADLIIYLSITFTPLNGSWKSIIVGLGSYKTIIPHHSPEILKEGSFMDPKNSGLHRIIWEMGDAIKDKIRVFTIEMVLNNIFFGGIFKKIYNPLKASNGNVSIWRRGVLSILRVMPRFIKAMVRKNLKARYRLIGAFAGDIEAVHEDSLKLVRKQLNVPIDKQYDVIIYGLPNLSPYNVGAPLNPLLLHTLISGYLYNMYNGRSPLKKGGILIVLNPGFKKFDLEQHPSYKDFYTEILKGNPDIFDLKQIEKLYLHNQNYLSKYRSNFAYHGTHALMVYYWGVLGLLNVRQIILAGAKNKDSVEILGYKYAKDLDDAINLSKNILGENCTMAYFCIPPIFIADLS